MNEMKKKMNMGASVVVVVLMLTMLFIPLSHAAPIQPFERSGTTTANTEVTAWIDGVQYGSNTSDASGNFVIDVNGDDVGTTTVKEGGVNGDLVTYMIGSSFATETDTFTSGSTITGNLNVAGTQPAMLKISKIVTQPNDGNNNQCLYIYNPTSSAVDLSAYQLEKDDGAYVSSVVPLSGTVAANGFAYVELTSTYFNTGGDEVKLNFTTTGVIVDRVEFGTQNTVPDNTIMGDAPAPGSGQEIYRTPNPDTDTNDCSADFTTGAAADRVAPTSSADALPTYETSATFTVTATASDDNTSGNASGVASVELYWSTSATTPYSNSAAMTDAGSGSWTASFNGNDGTTYYFYTVATDNAGNVEAVPSTYDTTTTVDTTAPTVTSTTPADGATNVAVGTNITVVYSESMDTSVTPTLSDNLGTTYTFSSWSDDHTATWTHSAWAPSTTVSPTVSGAKDVAGNVQTSYSWSFTTAPHTATATGPTNSAPSNVAGITITYTYDSGTTSVALYYTTDGGSTWTEIGTDSSIDGSYSWTIPADGTYGWTAVGDGETAPASGDAPEAASYTYDGTAPTVSSTTPADGDSNVAVGTNITVVYSESMDTSVTPTLSDNAGTTYTFNSWSDDHTATWTHSAWAPSTTVSPTVSSGQDLAGNVQTSYSWSFTTAPHTATATGPTNSAASNVAGITITYTYDSGTTSVALYYTTDGGSTWNLIGADATIDGSYAWTIPADGTYGWIAVGDGETAPASGDAPEAASYTYDGTAPTVSSTTPADSATNVAVGTNVVVIYSESMDTSVTPSLSDTAGTSYTFSSWSTTNVANDTATWTHADWATGTTVNPTVSGGQDLAGNVQTSYSWNFTTTQPSGSANVATGLWVEKNASANNITLHWVDTGSTDWNIYGSQNRSNVTDPSNLIATVSGPANSWTHVGAYGDGLNWYYVVRGSDGAGTESTNSTMGYKIIITLGYNDPSTATNGYWVSLPYNTTYYKDLESIIIDIEGGLSGSDDTYINGIYAWDGASQARVGETVGAFGWTGTNVALNPGDAVYIFRSDNTPEPYNWIVNGTDVNSSVTLGYNDPSTATNGYWVSVPASGVYTDLESIITDIEGGLSGSDDTYINGIYAWDGASQARVGETVGAFGWSGTNVALNPGDAVYIFRSDNTPSPYNWTVKLVTPAVP